MRLPRCSPLAALTVAATVLPAVSLPLTRRLRRRLPAEVADTISSAGVLVAITATTALAERRWPHRPEWSSNGRDSTDLAYLAVVAPPTGALTGVVVEAAVRNLRPPPADRTKRTPLGVQVVGALALSELVRYLQHRTAHRSDRLWRFHAVHHSGEQLNGLASFRFHPGEIIPTTAASMIGLRLLGIDGDALFVHHLLRTTHGIVQHANVAGSAGVLDHVFVTAAQHRHHHDRDPQRAAVAFGTVLTLWDAVFRTRPADVRTPFLREIGLAPGVVPDTLPAQLAHPFRRECDAGTREHPCRVAIP